ncbi:recombinase family protein [uncultured Microbacterium sp.]|uniref:recombinase family protein n=1 Tax=uncultured Microbacterium sp. TaxID=191216 RepID=UPI0028D38BA9|nr:recombinase family protein [uncultured Microbacterium sp.]
MEPKPRAALYARLSAPQSGRADDDNSDSIDNQLADLTALAADQGYEVYGTYYDDGISGYSGKLRPAFQRLLVDIADGRIDIVLARHADRLERNEAEGTILRVASIQAGVRWQYSSGQVVEPASAEGGLLARILSAISEFESQVKSERLRQHYQGQRLAGLLPAQKDCMGYAGFDVIPDEAELIAAAFHSFAEEEGTVRAIVSKWNAAKVPMKRGGSQGWSNAHVVGILRRPRYAGLVADRDGSIIDGLTGQWIRIVEPELWWKVQAKLDNPERKTNAKGRTPLSLAAGIATCGVCGFPLRTSTGKAWKTGEKYSILLCRNPDRGGARHPSGTIADLDPLIRRAVIDAFAFGPAQLFDEDHDSGATGEVYAQLADLRASRQRVLDWVEEGTLEAWEGKQRLNGYRERIEALQGRLDALVRSSAASGMLTDLRAGWIDSSTHRASYEGFTVLRDELELRFDALDIQRRRQLVKALLDVSVSNGQGTGKYTIVHTVVTSLNAADIA